MFSKLRDLRIIPAVVLSIVLSSLVITQTACPGSAEKPTRDEIYSWATEAVGIAREIVPIFESAGYSSHYVGEAIGAGDLLVTALNAHKDADALEQAAAMIDATNGIISDVINIQDQTKRTLILATLAGARIALRHISEKLKDVEDSGAVVAGGGGMKGARRGGNTALAKVRAFRTSKNFRCRSSQSGRWVEMSYCKAHPDVSQVETY
jgi:hypothetical protein